MFVTVLEPADCPCVPVSLSLTQRSRNGDCEMEWRPRIYTLERDRVSSTRGPGEMGNAVPRSVGTPRDNGPQRPFSHVMPELITQQTAGTGFIGPNELTYNSTSVTHQLHCVWFMGKTFSAVVTGGDIPEPDDYEAHFLHCVDYMRQAAMCAGDVAIEPRGENDQPGHANLVNAFNGLHGKVLLLEKDSITRRCRQRFIVLTKW